MIKIIFAGLDAAGKTSILLTIKEKFSHLNQLTPTKGRKRQKLDYYGSKILAWDLGGQEIYRKDYLKRPELFFAETDLIFYVVDIQDETRYAESLEYFEKIRTTLVKIEEAPQVIVVFHKMDPDLRDDAEMEAKVTKLQQEFENRVESLKILYERTTIFDRTTIEHMFSQGFQSISSVSEILERILETYFESIEADAVALIDSSGLILAHFAKDGHNDLLIVQTGLILQTLFRFHRDMGFEDREDLTLEYANRVFVMNKVKQIKDKSYYLWILSRDLESCLANMGFFKEDLFPLIGFYL